MRWVFNQIAVWIKKKLRNDTVCRLVRARQGPPRRKVLAIRTLLAWPVLSSQASLEIPTRLVSHSFPLKHLPCVGVKYRRGLGSWVNRAPLNPLTAILLRWRGCHGRGLAGTKAPWWQAYPSPVWTVRAANRVHLDSQSKINVGCCCSYLGVAFHALLSVIM